MLSKNKFIEILQRNFSPDDTVAIGLNKKWVNERTGNRFGRDFDQAFIRVSAIPDYVKSMRSKGDLYICFTPLEGKDRKKDKAKESYIIAQDIDGVPIPKDLEPSYYWETSPNKYQGIWILDNPVTPEEQEEINRRMIGKYKFDKTSADIVHFYRIPKTINHKYKTDFKVSGMKGKGTVYRKKELMKKLPKQVVTMSSSVIGSEKIPVKQYDLDSLLEKYHALKLYSSWVEGFDRSEFSWELSIHLRERGASKEEVKFVLLNMPFAKDKWNFDNVDPEVHRVFGKSEFSSKSSLGSLKFKGKKSVNNDTVWESGSLTLTKLADIEELNMEEQWLVEDIWANESVGIIGAPPKSFKSTLVTSLVLSVASGEPFCGKAVKQGAVVMVQGESNPQMERMKMYDIVGDKVNDLPIYFLDQPMTISEVDNLRQLILDNDIKLLILDPMYMLVGEDLNKQKEVTEALKQITRLRDSTGCSVILVHHSKKLQRGEHIRPDDLFGTTFINGWYESLILLQRTGANTSNMKTYFRNHISGTKYTLHINPDNLKANIYLQADEDEWSDQSKEQSSFNSIKEKE